MKFLFAEANDTVDPVYDFNTEYKPRDVLGCFAKPIYPHEVLGFEPYDGLLVSYATFTSKYRLSQRRELREVGATRFYRLRTGAMVMGDCGAFSYLSEKTPKYTVEEIAEWYATSGFTHGISVDHIIKRCALDDSQPTEDESYRYNTTLDNAEMFKRLANEFEPVGAVQGWSLESMSKAAVALEAMGYRYLAIGGLVGMGNREIERVVQTIRSKIKSGTRLHLLGVGNPDTMRHVRSLGVSSVDSTSPMLKAFKDESENYFLPSREGIDYLRAIRIPEALGSSRLHSAYASGSLDMIAMMRLEKAALKALRLFEKGKISAQTAARPISDYQSQIGEQKNGEREILATLDAKPWASCPCRACKDAGVDVVVFRGVNRNKRRGCHNLYVISRQMERWRQKEIAGLG